MFLPVHARHWHHSRPKKLSKKFKNIQTLQVSQHTEADLVWARSSSPKQGSAGSIPQRRGFAFAPLNKEARALPFNKKVLVPSPNEGVEPPPNEEVRVSFHQSRTFKLYPFSGWDQVSVPSPPSQGRLGSTLLTRRFGFLLYQRETSSGEGVPPSGCRWDTPICPKKDVLTINSLAMSCNLSR